MSVFKSKSKMVMALSLLGVIVGSFVVSDVLNRVGLKEGMENEEEEGPEMEEEKTMEEEIDAAMEEVDEEVPVEEGMKNKKEGMKSKKEGMKSKKEGINCNKKEGMKNKDGEEIEKVIEPTAAQSSLGLFKF